MNSYYSKLQAAVDSLDIAIKPKIAMIIGSGLSGLLKDAKVLQRIPYSKIEGFPRSSAPSHTGELLVTLISGVPVLIFSGRIHLYEGRSAQDVTLSIYLARLLEIDKVIITNAVGALNPHYNVGEMMLMGDHINLTAEDPTAGFNDDWLGPRFTDMSKPYSPRFRALWQRLAKEMDETCHEGIYVGVRGPSLETSAERRMMRNFGGDVVGMSSVLEVIVANHCGLEVLGISAICNMAVGDENQQVDTIADVLSNAESASVSMARILQKFLTVITTNEEFVA